MQIWDTTEAGGKWDRRRAVDRAASSTTRRARPAAIRWCWPTSRSASGTSFRILQVGERTWVWLNDKLVVDGARMENFWDRKLPLLAARADPAADARRRDPLAEHLVREIAAAEANAILAARDAAGFERIFNGKDLTGWKGPTEKYADRRRRDRLQAEQGRHDLHRSRVRATSVARLEFKLPPGGNNGLAIRYPGEGDTAYVGMCELQVLDNDAAEIREARPAAVHGSVYGMVRGAPRLPAAERASGTSRR